ncbi:organic cation transporter protein-like [Microplitis mediator]|uniref:organic cation transporter protein-like n=1 Tax=Microplitis mediator TaxID=375433 RepID=UPI002556593C|nr:organic cation transporter protein-like [Microplitis mediator]XP_057339225.1 organic cation transporter protein-like [Microplitis mediator]XP_057339226.1 organic cation transporter protein-like [Microplitis mediator]
MSKQEIKVMEEKCLLQAIDDLGKGSKLLWIIFIINFLISILFGLNSMSYVFVAEIPEYWCYTPELIDWTTDQINNISMVDKCLKYDHNYTHLADLGFEEATKYVNNFELMPSTVSCSMFMFDDSERSTIVNEWQLVCDNKLHRANTFLMYSLGMTCGSSFLGIYADKYGRKNSLIISIILQIIAGPLSALVPWFWAYLILKFLTGISTGAMYSSGYTILSEIATSNRIKVFAGIIDITFSIGTFLLIGMAYFLQDWRQLQIAISCFILPIIVLIWFIPESPRWLISQNRHDEAQKIIDKHHKSFVMTSTSNIESPTSEPRISSVECNEKLEDRKGFFHRNFESLKILFTNSDLRKKTFIVDFSYYVTATGSYILVFSVDNFKSSRYLYMSIVAVNEVLGVLAISVILKFFTSRKSLIITYTVAFVLMITISTIPEENTNIIMGLALAGKFCFSASFTVNLVFLSELFPSNVRNTAFGTCLVMSQTGCMTAPYILDLLGNVAWWAPTTLCSVLSLMAGLFCFAIPQTKLNSGKDTHVDGEVTGSGHNTK